MILRDARGARVRIVSEAAGLDRYKAKRKKKQGGDNRRLMMLVVNHRMNSTDDNTGREKKVEKPGKVQYLYCKKNTLVLSELSFYLSFFMEMPL